MKLKGAPGASLEFFQPLPQPLALIEPLEVASSAAVKPPGADSSAPTDTPDILKVISGGGQGDSNTCGFSASACPEFSKYT